jgi:alpha-tubulin suppressor-like RCC1 family protein
LIPDSESRLLVLDLPRFTRLALGRYNACASIAEPAWFCWGDNQYGQAPRSLDVDGLERNGEVRCWGANHPSLLGDETFAERAEPRPIPGVSNAIDVGAGSTFACALTGTGRVICWGNTFLPEGGHDVVAVVPHLDEAKKLHVGGYHSCVLNEHGEAFCWGYNHEHVIDATDEERISVPVRLDHPHRIRELALGYQHTCLLDENGDVFCAGDNHRRQLGDGTYEPRKGLMQVALD